MNDEYRLAAYAVAVSLAVLAISGAIVVAGDAPPDSSPSSTDRTDQNVTIDEANRIDISVADSNSTVAFDQGERTCRGNLRVDDPDQTRTDVELEGVTVTLVEDHDEPFDEINREQFAELVWDEVSATAGFENYDHVEIRVNQYYETVAREEPRDTVGVRVRPVDDCLPTVEAEVMLDNQSVDVRAAHPEIEDLELNVTDTMGVLDDTERKLLEQLLESNTYASYTIQTEFDTSSQLNATVLKATNDGVIEVKLTDPTIEGHTVITRVNLESETVLNTWTKISIEQSDGSNTVVVSDATDNSTVTFERGE
ncbi:hypothetical protein [Halobellus rufus]|uniref:hypothetical protein n=1 Tax=Halobellus rufus TaxID=1448860 RepID=UPI000678CD50|nr:hypothetical protein [Halobellus rufus]